MNNKIPENKYIGKFSSGIWFMICIRQGKSEFPLPAGQKKKEGRRIV